MSQQTDGDGATPAVMKARQYPYTVCQGGYAAGRWRHWQPVRNTWISASSTSRMIVVRGRPPGLAGGSIGDSSANSPSLSRRPHPTHTHLDAVLDWAEEMKVGKLYLSHLNNSMDYKTLVDELPSWAAPAHDGLEIEL